MTNPQLIVINDNCIGYFINQDSLDDFRSVVVISSTIGGPNWQNGSITVSCSLDKIRKATITDLDKFRIYRGK